MGLFDHLFGKNSEDDRDVRSQFFSSSSRVECRQDEDGEMRCKKYVRSSDNPGTEEIEEVPFEFGPGPAFKSMFRPFIKDFDDEDDEDDEHHMMFGGPRFGIFGNFFKDFEQFEKEFLGRNNDFFSERPDFGRFDRQRHDSEFEGFKTKAPSQKDTNIYDI
ncbi:hypothetical protein SteCoe_38065 [Stentor coeruleus]|uniref:Uncharacterized protein n=1 Tax=Stentor coeruleus TaxID=5963 RepID=A0A1R2AM85_9CILI|nr:hypothetical protein SteCoe_38065 [Stentor coeruleus]